MDIFEQADAFTPSRAVLQEEEEAAAPSASGFLRPAVCVWNKGLVGRLFPKGLSCRVLVVATCPTSAALLAALPGKQLIGTVLAPGVSLAGTSLPAPGSGPLPSDRVCCVYSLPGPDGPEAGALLVVCQYGVARERCSAWARAVLSQMSYGHAVFLGAMAAEQFRGQGDASQESLLFSLATKAAQQRRTEQGGAPSAPPLPTGSLVGGLPAALLSHCQVRGQSAELLVTVEMVMEGRAAAAEALAGALAAALGGSSGVPAAAEALRTPGVRAAARRALGVGAGAQADVYA
ncbi:hypothetical protein HYH03_005746 [Edaphochlamys debaryana]|uniref:Proteasome assembly chaperone 1 n=1 Tax=Edaphochlamys debaryana TaxID=47281 RepID=A0A835YEI9_9CHLO|nr:hypothetical protein HYH03_005746 [Edaphochlamys debaryana]|eukprot:KAG2496144.1 hypothetical protein HYH03_005746 [Edaphochlamys debaryana]